MSQIVVYKGVTVEPVERSDGKIRIRTKNPVDAKKAEIPFHDMVDGLAIFEAWVAENELVVVD
jgi:hypothetical protein